MYDHDDDSDEVGGFIFDLDESADPVTVDAVCAALEECDDVTVVRQERRILVFGTGWEEARDAAMMVLYIRGHIPAGGEPGDA